MREKILYVDDEPEILQSFSRQFGRKYEIECALGGTEGLGMIASQGPYAVVLSEMTMPGIDGITFLTKVKALAPDSVRMMLTGADPTTAVQATHEGIVFRFLAKPCPPEIIELALESALGHYRLEMSERALHANSLTGAIKILTDVLATVRPVAFGRTGRVRELVRRMAKDLIPNQLWRAELAALLSQLSCVKIPEEVLAKAYPRKGPSEHECAAFEEHPRVGRQLVANVPRMEEVGEIILQQNKCVDGSGLPNDGVAGETIPIEARILKVAIDYDSLLQSGADATQALVQMGQTKGQYDRTVLVALVKSIAQEAVPREEALAT